MGKGSAKKRGRDVLPPTSAEKKPVEIDESRLANRKYAQAYRWRRQNHLEQLEIETRKIEEEIYLRKMASLRKVGTSSSAKLEEPSTKLSLGMVGSSFQSKMVTVVDDHRERKKMPMNNNNPVPHIDLTLDDDDDLPVKKKVIEVGGGSSSRGGSEGRRAIPLAPNSRRSVQEVMERRRINRLSAKRSRERKNEYVAEMERQAKYLEHKITMLHPRVMAFQHQRRLLLIEQNEMKFRMSLVEHDRLLKERQTEKMKEEIMRLLEIKKRQEKIRAEEMKTWGADISLMCPNPNPAGPSKPLVIASTSSPVKEIEADDTDNNLINKGKGKAKAY